MAPDPRASRRCCATTAWRCSRASRSSCARARWRRRCCCALQEELLAREAWPLIRAELPGADEAFWQHARDAHLDGFPAAELAEAQATDASIGIQAPANTRALAHVDAERMARAARARAPVREAALARRWCLTLWPTAAGAQQAGMGTTEFAAFVRRALFLDRGDATAAWTELRHFQDAADRAPEGRARAAHRGRGHRPDAVRRRAVPGSTPTASATCPRARSSPARVETSAEGRIRFTIPSSPRGVEVAGIELEFREGRVVDARAERGEEYLKATLATDDGASLLGEIGIGTNFGIDRPVGAILFDEKIGGTVHLAVGRSYPETGGTNESAVHWDMICDLRRGGTLYADGEPIQRDGRFLV